METVLAIFAALARWSRALFTELFLCAIALPLEGLAGNTVIIDYGNRAELPVSE